MDYIGQICDHYDIEYDKTLHIKYTINNFNFDELDKIINDYIKTHNKKFYSYLINCELVLEVDIVTEKTETNY